MPASAFLTAAHARAQVLTLLGAASDGENSADLIAQIKGVLGLVHRNLCVEFAAILGRSLAQQTITAGRAVYPLPCSAEGIKTVLASQGGASFRLGYGQTVEDKLATAQGTPSSYAIRPYVGVAAVTVNAGGSGYTNGAAVTFSAPPAGGTLATGVLEVVGGVIQRVIITDPGSGYLAAPTVTAPTGSGATLVATLASIDQIMVVPAPSAGGTLTVEHVATPGPTLDDQEALAIDPGAVVAITAATVAEATDHVLAKPLAGEAAKSVNLLRSRMPMRSSGGSFSMAGGRRNG